MISVYDNPTVGKFINEFIFQKNKQYPGLDARENNSGIFQSADICLRLLFKESRSYVIEFFDSKKQFSKKTAFDLAHPKFIKNIKKNPHLSFISKKAHYICYKQKGKIKFPPLISSSDFLSFSNTVKRFCNQAFDKKYNSGMSNVEFLKYFNNLAYYYDLDENSNIYILNIYKGQRINLFPINKVLSTIDSFDVIPELDEFRATEIFV